MAVARFSASPIGRGLRVLAGLVLMALGYRGTPLWVPLLGIVVTLGGVFNLCLIAPLFGGPYDGRRIDRRDG